MSQRLLDVSLIFEETTDKGLNMDELILQPRRSSAPDGSVDAKKRDSLKDQNLNLEPLLEDGKSSDDKKSYPERTTSISRSRGIKGRKFSTKRAGSSSLSNTVENDSENSLEEKTDINRDAPSASPTLSRKGKLRNGSIESTASSISGKTIAIPKRSISLPSKEVDSVILDVTRRLLGVTGLAANWRLIKCFNSQIEPLPLVLSPSLSPSESKYSNINLIIDHLHRALQLVSDETKSLLEARISALLGVANDLKGKPDIAKEWFAKSIACIQHQIGQIFPDKEDSDVMTSNMNLDDQKAIYEGIKRIMAQTSGTQEQDVVVIDPAWFAELLGNMGNVCYVLLEVKEAIRWLRKSVLIYRQITTTYSKYAQPFIRPIAQLMHSSEAGIVRGYSQLAACFQAMNTIPTALYYARKAYASVEEHRQTLAIHSPNTIVHTMVILETVNLVAGNKCLSLCFAEEGLEHSTNDYSHFLMFRKAACTSENAALRHILWKNFLKTCTKDQFNDLTGRNITTNFSAFVKSMLNEAISSFESANVENNDILFDARLHLFRCEGIAQILLLLENGKSSFSHLSGTLKKQATRGKISLGLPHDFVIHMYRRLYSHLGQTLKPSMMSGTDLSIGFSIEECMSSPCIQYHDHYIKSSQAVGDVFGKIIGLLRLSYTHYNIASKMYANTGPSQDESLEKSFNYCSEAIKISLLHNFYNLTSVALLQIASILECFRELTGLRDPQYRIDINKEAKKIVLMKETCFLDWDNWTQPRVFATLKSNKAELNQSIIQYRWLGLMIMMVNIYVVSKEETYVVENMDNPNGLLKTHFEKITKMGDKGHILCYLGDQDEIICTEMFKVLEVNSNILSQVQDWLDGIH